MKVPGQKDNLKFYKWGGKKKKEKSHCTSVRWKKVLVIYIGREMVINENHSHSLSTASNGWQAKIGT